jgi:hypothetical protein
MRHLSAEEAPELGGDRREDLSRRRVLRDERRHAAERRLLVGERGAFLLERRELLADRDQAPRHMRRLAR